VEKVNAEKIDLTPVKDKYAAYQETCQAMEKSFKKDVLFKWKKTWPN